MGANEWQGCELREAGPANARRTHFVMTDQPARTTELILDIMDRSAEVA